MGRSGNQDSPPARRGSRGLPSSHRVTSERPNIVEVGDDESGRCGICSAPVLNRGVLDCCSHVFCFDCIDNWATVSNHCPLCKLQFRFISVESITRNCHQNGGDQFFPTAVKQEREDEPWGDEEALPLSFPSFFIDEDAVACLDGQRCLIRAGVPVEEDAADTSVACDSCDRWYHAGCVGFDPSISWGSWLCPRCSTMASSQLPPPRSFVPSALPLTTVVSSSSSGRVPMAELAYDAIGVSAADASVSISRADEGESALVFDSWRVADYSILPTRPNQPGKPITIKGTGEAPIVVKAEEVTFPSLGVEASSCQALGSLLFENQVFEGQEFMDSTITLNLQSPVELVCNRPAEVQPSDQKSKEPTNAPSTLLSTGKVEKVGITEAEVRPSKQKSRVAATDRIVLVSDCTTLGGRAEQIEGGQGEEGSKPDQSEGGKSNDPVARDRDGVCPELPASYFDWAEGDAQPDREFQEEIKGKRKQAKQDRDSIRAEDLPEPPRKVARNAAKRKEPVHGSSNRVGADKAPPSMLEEENQASGVKGSLSADLEECELPYIEGAPVEDLMNMVKDEHTGRIASNMASGPRTRIVMRRTTDGHAAQLVENIRQQMRSAAGYGASYDLGKVEVSDDKFFAAFKGPSAEGEIPCFLNEMQPSLNTSIVYLIKAALTRTNEQRRGANSRNVKRRRHSWTAKMLDQAPHGKTGGVRESLTKKLYAGGVSRKTWDRDWDIAFWKERSASLKKARQAAVNLVGRRGGDCGGESRRDGSVVKLEEEALLRLKDPDADSGDSILTRLYVADTSLFPRDEDIKPLLSLKVAKEEEKPTCSVVQEVVAGTGKPGDLPALQTRTDMGLIESTSVSKRGPIASGVQASFGQLPIPSLQGFAKASSVGGPGKIKEGTVTSSVLQYPHQTARAGGSDKITCTPSKISCSPPPSDEKKDKRQWALELLARKSGDATASSSGKSGAGIKESSLLSQVPYELKPTLPLERRSRVPTAVRQLQLNRLLEHHLHKAKLASLQGGYKLKSVIAAAVAKEVEIYGNSNSKGVYVNLCVRALSQQDEVTLQVSIPPPFGPGREASITEALLATGLISDSPPGSPSTQQNTSMKSSSELSNYQTNADISTSSNVPKISETPVGSGGVVQDFPTSSPFISLATSFIPQFQQDEADDVLELAIPPSVDLYTDLDLDLEEFGPAGTGSKLSESVSSCVDSSSKKLKVLLTADIKCGPSEVLEDRHNLPKEPGLIRVNKSLESKNIGTHTLQPSASENVGEGTTVFPSSEGSDLMKVENREKSPILKQSCEREGRTSTDNAGKAQQISANTIPSRDREGSTERNSKEGKVENTTGDPAETCPDSEFEGDDWMRSGKFPDLESRIDKMRTDVLQMNSKFLSQFGEAHVFGGSTERPAAVFEKMQDGGLEGHTSMLGNYDKSERRLHTAVPDGPGGEAVRQSVRKQVESYVKEHLKPLYKSGVIKAEQFRYAVSKTASKVMQHHGDAKSADFLILEGSKVKKLADQYLQGFAHRK